MAAYRTSEWAGGFGGPFGHGTVTEALTADTRRRNEDVVHIALSVKEDRLREQVKHRRGRWNAQQRRWEVRREHILALG